MIFIRFGYNYKTKEYFNGEKLCVVYNNYYISLNNKPSSKGVRGSARLKSKSIASSIARTRNAIYDIAKSNNWDYMITLTFNSEKVNSRYDYNELLKKVSVWLHNQKKRKSPNLKYLIVPDLHKEDVWGKAFHFHGLLSDIGDMELIETNKKDKNNRVIYNIKGFTAGFTTATKISSTKKVSNYITKYITKEMAVYTFNKKKYLCSQGLNRPIEKCTLLSKEQLLSVDEHLTNVASYKNVSYYDITGNIDFTKKTSYYYL